MKTVTASIARSPDACWRTFTAAATMPRWVPGLREARVLESDRADRATEIDFEYAGGLTYALRYTYDPVAHVVTWEPVDEDGKRGGVRGHARFDATPDGTEMTYALEHDEGRKAAERALDDPNRLVEAFTRWMHEDRD